LKICVASVLTRLSLVASTIPSGIASVADVTATSSGAPSLGVFAG
jgi:hypothetical protein